MICQKCGTTNPDTAKFCQSCGAALPTPTSANTGYTAAPGYNPAPGSAPGYNSNPGYNAAPGYNSNPGYNPVPGGYGYPAADEGKGFAIASLILGILSFIVFGIIFGPLAIVLGVVAKNKGSKSPMATAGIVIGAIGTALMIISYILLALML